MEPVCGSSPLVEAEVAVPNLVVGIVGAVKTAETVEAAGVGVIAPEPAGPIPVAPETAEVVEEPTAPIRSATEERADSTPAAVATAAARVVGIVVQTAGPIPAAVGDPTHSASRAVVRPRTLQQRVQRAPACHCGYAARCRARPAQPLPQ